MKTIKENINSKEFNKLMIYTRGREDLRRNTKSNLLRTLVFLYYTEARLNELQTRDTTTTTFGVVIEG